MEDRKKKDAPFGTPIPKQDYGTTPVREKQWLAEILLDLVGDREHPMPRPKNPSVDRCLRGLISEKNAAGEDILINLGNGYFKAGPDDGPALKEYVYKELHRADEIRNKAYTMLETWKGRYQ